MNETVTEHVYKILFVGDAGTGKTSIIRRHVHGLFSENYKATIGVDFAVKSVSLDANTIAKLQLWDIAGQERFGSMSKIYYIGAVGAVIVFDMTTYRTFEAVNKWRDNLLTNLFDDTRKASGFPIVVFGNKSDLVDENLDEADLEKSFVEKGYTGFNLTSAKTNSGIASGLYKLVAAIPRMEETKRPTVPRLVLSTPRNASDSESDDDCMC
jgi:Ras-related protein Rab-32